ncbi:GspE/PulE family protein [Coraliomargarita akajimensis]|uniref:Type II secretion system protein E n=1 Tax=Coraliomargarita akajimensis (strain DSM 45221 / IAM 15411 / JCM 23193 / KCTC 12865 / 04OKA010-24) TaxID=583355 RepID=D5EJ67_CORAD|nr:GspE/PulE family protein [Coraliomargarita akajimensis]ADE54466.1 type II secretion system protein E [Coraliomargarita akajimensis DSM 45221]
MFEDHNDTIFEIIKSTELLDDSQLNELNESHLHTGKSLADAVVDSGLVERSAILSAVADYLGYEYIGDPPSEIPEYVASSVRASVARMYAVVPYQSDDSSVSFLAKDPFNASIIDDLTFSLNKDIYIAVCDPEYLDSLLVNTYGEENSSMDDIIGDLGDSFEEIEEDISDMELTDMANQTPIIRFVNLVLQQAIRDKASDIHFEPFEDQFRIRYRIDGALYEMAPPPKNLAVPVISRVKVLSNMNISETRIPQDGRIKMTIAGRPVDLRVSTLPTQFGESVVLRVLDKSVVNLDLDALTLPDDILAKIRELVARPNGIFIVTGPTGSGKTTTLYSALREVNKVETKILTAEDPVEYEIDGIMQVAVNHQVGLDFARALRAFLRQDPDKIMVGEIRDLETAQIAVQASLTGHVVLSTLHTNDAPGAVTRLIDMGLDAFLISASLEAILAQRLVRRICRTCRTAYEPGPEMIEMLEVDPLEIADKDFYYGEGCPECSNTGYRGRIGLFEMVVVTDAIRELINQKAPTLAIKQKALEQGMRALRDDGLRAIFDGNATIEEVLKYT